MDTMSKTSDTFDTSDTISIALRDNHTLRDIINDSKTIRTNNDHLMSLLLTNTNRMNYEGDCEDCEDCEDLDEDNILVNDDIRKTNTLDIIDDNIHDIINTVKNLDNINNRDRDDYKCGGMNCIFKTQLSSYTCRKGTTKNVILRISKNSIEPTDNIVLQNYLEEAKLMLKYSKLKIHPKIYDIAYVKNTNNNTYYFISVMDVYSMDLSVFLNRYYNNIKNNKLIIKSLRDQTLNIFGTISKSGIVCMDVKPQNFVIDYIMGENNTMKSVDLKIIDVDNNFCSEITDNKVESKIFAELQQDAIYKMVLLFRLHLIYKSFFRWDYIGNIIDNKTTTDITEYLRIYNNVITTCITSRKSVFLELFHEYFLKGIDGYTFRTIYYNPNPDTLYIIQRTGLALISNTFPNLIMHCIPQVPEIKIVNKWDQHNDINDRMRIILIHWLYTVHMSMGNEISGDYNALYRAIQILDDYLSKKTILRDKLQLLGITVYYIAILYSGHEYYYQYTDNIINELIRVCDGAYARRQLIEFLHVVLNTVNIYRTTPLDSIVYKNNSLMTDIVDALLLVTIFDSKFIKYPPIIIGKSITLLREDIYKHLKCTPITNNNVNIQSINMSVNECTVDIIRTCAASIISQDEHYSGIYTEYNRIFEVLDVMQKLNLF